VGVLGHYFEDVLTGESFVAETFFQFAEDFLVVCIFWVED
jgi:hypothetical protein